MPAATETFTKNQVREQLFLIIKEYSSLTRFFLDSADRLRPQHTQYLIHGGEPPAHLVTRILDEGRHALRHGQLGDVNHARPRGDHVFHFIIRNQDFVKSGAAAVARVVAFLATLATESG